MLDYIWVVERKKEIRDDSAGFGLKNRTDVMCYLIKRERNRMSWFGWEGEGVWIGEASEAYETCR